MGDEVSDEEALLALDAKRLQAMNQADPELMLSVLHDDHVHVMANGVVTDKAGAGEGVRNKSRKVEPGELKVRIYGDFAVVTGAQTNHEQINGQPVTLQLFVTRVARRVDGVWKFISLHATRMPE